MFNINAGKQAHSAHVKFHETHGHEFYESFDLFPERTKALIVATLNEYADYMKSYTGYAGENDGGEDSDSPE